MGNIFHPNYDEWQNQNKWTGEKSKQTSKQTGYTEILANFPPLTKYYPLKDNDYPIYAYTINNSPLTIDNINYPLRI